MKIISIQIKTHKDGVPNDIYAVFDDGQHLTLDYQRTWRQCFANLSNKIFDEAEFLHHIETDGINSPWKDMTRNDWANVCFAYRKEMEA